MVHTKNQQEAAGFVTAAWVKQRYSIANSTLYLWIFNKRLPAPVKLGSRAIRFRLEDILAFEAQLTSAKGSQAAAAMGEQPNAR